MTGAVLANRIMREHPDSEIARYLPGAGRFSLDRYVTAVIDRFSGEPMRFHAVLQWARLPHDVTWIEFDARANSGRVLRIGYLALTEEAPQFSIRAAAAMETCDIVTGAVLVQESGVLFRDERPGDREILASAAGHVLRFALLLNARNRIVTIEAAEDLSRLNRARAKRGNPPLLGAQPVTIDVSREQRRYLRSGGAGFNRDAARAHLVRGHFKLRATGVFWWSPFMRGGFADGADYGVTASRPRAAEKIIRSAG